MKRSKLIRSLGVAGCLWLACAGNLLAAGLPAVLLRGWPLHLACERRENPLGIDNVRPRLSWWVGDDTAGAMQSSYQILVASSPAKLDAAPDIWDSGKVVSEQSVDVLYAGPPLVSEQRCYWKVRTWDQKGKESEWSEVNWWEMGLLSPADWKAKWITAPARDTSVSAPAVYFRKEFVVTGHLRRVRLYVSARGLYEMRLDGERVGRDRLAPGWTDYHKRNQYIVYDLTGVTTGGLNVLGAVLGDGWHNGYLKLRAGMKKNWYGDDTSLIAQLVVEYEDGHRQVYGTDESWGVNTGPILASDIYDGENYDARKELEVGGQTWDAPGYDGSRWGHPRIAEAPTGVLVAKVDHPVRPQEVLAAKSLHRAPNGEWVYDFGQNVAGVVRFKLNGQAGHTVTLRYAEMLNPDGSLYTANLRDAKATDRYTFDEDGAAVWEPQFTYHGFQYVGISGLQQQPAQDAVKAVVLHNDIPPTGHFETSNPLLNQLQSNIRWSQKDNACDVPTDCPQRDERLGWTGDANFFLPTATFNYDEATFIEKWMTDLRDAQTADGRFTVYAPAPDPSREAAAYSDAGVICPWIIYEHYGDVKILEDNFTAMEAWIEFQRRTSKDLIRPGTSYGDWLAPDANEGRDSTPRDLIGTAYFAHTTELAGRAAAVLGRRQEVQKFEKLHQQIVAAFQQKFIDANGRPGTGSQAAYALVLAFDLLPEGSREAAVKHLVDDLRARDWKMATGFVGTPLLMRVLKRFNQHDAAYHLLLQREYPGWLYMVDQGATTIWERWNSYRPETGFGDVKMNSFNHTVWGSVGEWMYAVIGGIDFDPAVPGFKHIIIHPRPGGDLTWAKAELDSPYGRISTHWKRQGDSFSLTVGIPPNTRATVELPNGKSHELGAGVHSFESPWSL